MNNELTLKITGEAGQGMLTIGSALCKIFENAGFYLFANNDYMSRIRGGNNFLQLRISDRPLYTLRQNIDITVALDSKSVSMHKEDVSRDGVIILDKKRFHISEENSIFLDIPMYDMAKEIGNELFVNSIACGLLTEMTGIEFHYIDKVLRAAFSDKKEDIINKNIDAAQAGYDFAKNNFKRNTFKIKRGNAKDTLLMTANDAIVLGAISAGCKFYSAYPMTPSTGIMDLMAHYAKKFHMVVEQAEDEIAAINMAIGASYAGVRSMTGTSGGGFSLMVEGLSLAGMTETPIVIYEGQRPGPATGFPTRTEQGDLAFLLSAGHGEFARVIFSPGTIEEAFYLTIKAFNIAEKFQIPVLIMSDQHLADSYRNIEMFDLSKVKVQRYIISKEDSRGIKDYKRYQFTESGISPRAIPSWINDPIYADSDEHTEEGHITEDAGIRTMMVEKRFSRKMAGLSKEIEKPKAFDVKGADCILIGFGSTYGVLKEAKESITNKKIGFIHLPQVWPFPAAEMIELLQGAKKIIVVENNAGAQLARLLKQETGIKADKSLLKFDGRPFNLDFLIQHIEQEK
ncbi:MAG: 2-oxoacid:acceptor oxidoreductase subunit alpha [Candidatus Jettenia sp.]|uniref:2-oxoglutarate ferredoxin oxidoreductase alpha subunit n=1 Tax=Candidatus Jettenia caeni TaxID=247490 RepID=I3IGZ6_9BACT|nr:2-oxoacid:acceptor oxidoreductase subunit alpha [Candidatus Jettenia sp. AMX1]MBC6929047.1 2-oxoacid:acceptor oxidoreductase subunit alpha [Candidatus Jettenia sp.]NUN23545.1 2-oxoacid:acceptor oxidoreductase subunit alpha [Candidatus Jettenia caeni]KAA0249333.1 MAG: 2-oxoacid:acceptor oxidoreductase subunit alpha [Candidatus Jettenia sp. AMX1]MCE7881478.1 2-oxoacid:acceptor oxidoreductase subunit alpha [Candidatus Jettenia sp. AMX1]MCQ3928036.1 2-oxoacid:acceptor oxidoreductase subunit alp